MPQAEHQVFISYATPDRAAADRVCRALEQAGVSCWIANRDIEAGTIFPATIVEALNTARAVVLVLTEHAVASPHVLSEVGYAFNAKKRILPFRLSPVDLPDELEYYLSLTQWLDAPDGCTDENLARLTAATLDSLAGRPRLRRGPEATRRLGMIAAVVAGVLAAAAGAVYWAWPARPGPTTTAVNPIEGQANVPISPGIVPPEKKTWLNPEDGQTYVWIAPGTFTMGCSPGDDQCRDDEKPAHPVRIDRGFWLAETEVTVAAYRKSAAKHRIKASAGGDDTLPVTRLTWAQATQYCGAIGGRLPTEAEWEYAARAGRVQPTDDMPREIAWYGEEDRDRPHPVRTKAPNAFGLHDMLGNVAEWVFDRYFNRYDPDAPATGPEVESPARAGNATAVVRGGSWASGAVSIRVSHRGQAEPDARAPTIGFRCASDRAS